MTIGNLLFHHDFISDFQSSSPSAASKLINSNSFHLKANSELSLYSSFIFAVSPVGVSICPSGTPKLKLAKRAKELDLDAIHDTVYEMAKDEARHGKAFEGLLNRYFK